MLLCGHAFAALTPRLEPRIGRVAEAFFYFDELIGISIWCPRDGGYIFLWFFKELMGISI